MASDLHFSFLLISLFFHLSSAMFYLNADKELINTVCKDSTDNQFCIQTFENDPRTPAANLDGLCLISVALTIDQVSETSGKIPGLLKQASDPIMIERLQFCQRNYTDAVSKFHEAYTSALAKSYRDILDRVSEGFNNGTACQNVFRSSPPIQESPFSAETNMLLKLVELPGLVIDRIFG